MAGIDGTQVMQTINVPKSVLIGASERPVLLTVTPKNGIHKGQKQIVVLTRNQGGIGAVAKSAILASTTPGTSPASPTKVMLGPRPEVQSSPGTMMGLGPPTATSLPSPRPPVADINRLLAQSQPVSSSELQRQGMMPSPQQQQVSYPATVYNNMASTQRVIVSQAQHLGQTHSVSNSSSSPVQFVVQRPVVQMQQQQAGLAATAGSQQQPQQRIVQTVMRTGPMLPQLVMQNGKPVLVTSAASAQQELQQRQLQQQQQQQLVPQVSCHVQRHV